MNETVIISSAKASVRLTGVLNDTDAPILAGHVIAETVELTRIEPGEVESRRGHGLPDAVGHHVTNVARKVRSAPVSR